MTRTIRESTARACSAGHGRPRVRSPPGCSFGGPVDCGQPGLSSSGQAAGMRLGCRPTRTVAPGVDHQATAGLVDRNTSSCAPLVRSAGMSTIRESCPEVRGNGVSRAVRTHQLYSQRRDWATSSVPACTRWPAARRRSAARDGAAPNRTPRAQTSTPTTNVTPARRRFITNSLDSVCVTTCTPPDHRPCFSWAPCMQASTSGDSEIRRIQARVPGWIGSSRRQRIEVSPGSHALARSRLPGRPRPRFTASSCWHRQSPSSARAPSPELRAVHRSTAPRLSIAADTCQCSDIRGSGWRHRDPPSPSASAVLPPGDRFHGPTAMTRLTIRPTAGVPSTPQGTPPGTLSPSRDKGARVHASGSWTSRIGALTNWGKTPSRPTKTDSRHSGASVGCESGITVHSA